MSWHRPGRAAVCFSLVVRGTRCCTLSTRYGSGTDRRGAPWRMRGHTIAAWLRWRSTRDAVLVLYGGTQGSVGRSSGTRYGDTWEWDGCRWTERNVNTPGPRDHHAVGTNRVQPAPRDGVANRVAENPLGRWLLQIRAAPVAVEHDAVENGLGARRCDARHGHLGARRVEEVLGRDSLIGDDRLRLAGGSSPGLGGGLAGAGSGNRRQRVPGAHLADQTGREQATERAHEYIHDEQPSRHV